MTIEFGQPDDDFSKVRLGPGGLPVEVEDKPGPPPVPPPASQLPPPPGINAGSDLAALFAEAERTLDLGPVDLPVPHRPGWAVRYRRLTDDRELQPWRVEAYDPTVLEGIDNVTLSTRALVELCLGFVRDGRLALDERSQPLTFKHSQFRAALQQDGETAPPDPLETVRRWYGLDREAEASWAALCGLSGFSTIILPGSPGPT